MSNRAEVLDDEAAKLVTVFVTVRLVGVDPPCFDCDWFLRAEDGTYPDHGTAYAVSRPEFIETVCAAARRAGEIGAKHVEIAIAVGTGVPRPLSLGLVEKMVAGTVQAADLLL